MSTSLLVVSVLGSVTPAAFSPPINLGGKKLVGVYQSSPNPASGSRQLKLEVAGDQVTPGDWLPVRYPSTTDIWPLNVLNSNVNQYASIPEQLQVLPDVIRLDLGGTTFTDLEFVLVLEDGCSINISGC